LTIKSLSFGHGLLVAFCKDTLKSYQIIVWRVSSATNIQHEKNLPIAGDEDQTTAHMAMDEHYITIILEMPQLTKIYFISTETLTLVDSMTVASIDGRILRYHRGLLITQKQNLIR
jgi:hypothetical protein